MQLSDRRGEMDTGHFANFLAATGHRVVQSDSCCWYEASRGFFLSFPSHRLVEPSDADLRSLFRRPCLGLRFTAPLAGPGKLSYQIVCDTPDYGIERLSTNTRSKIRRGLRRCDVGPISFAEIARSGRALDRQTLARQGRPVRLKGSAWERYWEAAAATPGMEAWAAFVKGELAAFLVSVRLEDCVEFMLARSRTDCLDAYPNNALIFRASEEMLLRRAVRQITFGLESLEPVGPLDQFKFSMGFRAEPLRQRVVFHPLATALLRKAAIRSLIYRWAEGRGPEGGFAKKAVGLLRFAEEGGELAAAMRQGQGATRT